MEIKEVIGLAFLAFTLVFALLTMWRFKRMADSRKETDARFAALKEKMDNRLKEIDEGKARQKMRSHPNYSHARFDTTNPDVLKPRKRDIAKTYASPTQTQSVSNNSVGIQSQGSTTTVIHDSSSDLLTNVALWTIMNNSRASSVSGTYDEDTGRVNITTREEPKEETRSSSYSSSYSSSSSDDDDNRRSSYSSSYSSSSSDDSYSSSSSDSSYSSSD